MDSSRNGSWCVCRRRPSKVQEVEHHRCRNWSWCYILSCRRWCLRRWFHLTVCCSHSRLAGSYSLSRHIRRCASIRRRRGSWPRRRWRSGHCRSWHANVGISSRVIVLAAFIFVANKSFSRGSIRQVGWLRSSRLCQAGLKDGIDHRVSSILHGAYLLFFPCSKR